MLTRYFIHIVQRRIRIFLIDVPRPSLGSESLVDRGLSKSKMDFPSLERNRMLQAKDH